VGLGWGSESVDETQVSAKTPEARRKRRRRLAGLGLLALLWIALLNAPVGALREAQPGHNSRPLVVDKELSIARRFAPYVYHSIHPTGGRQDIPTRVDFDGDLVGANSWENMPNFELPPTVYYAVLETETHTFIAYHLFHPRDWSYLRIGINLTHENDGENFAVVVDKARSEPVLLFTQAHYFGRAYANSSAGFGDGKEHLRGPLLLLDEQGRPSPKGRHVGVYVEEMGHGIYGAKDPSVDLTVDAQGGARFGTAGMTLRPARAGDVVAEPRGPLPGVTAPYQLESTSAKLWPLLAAGRLTGEGRLLDGAVSLDRPFIKIELPRFYEADRFSGLFGSDRGIAPFALCFSFWSGQIGALFFDPAGRYPELLKVPQPWSTKYLRYPFKSALRGK